MRFAITIWIILGMASHLYSQESQMNQAKELKEKEEFQSAYDLFKEAGDLYLRSGSKEEYVVAHLEMIDSQLQKGDPFLAKSLAENTLEYVDSELKNSKEIRARTLTLLGYSYLNLGRNDEALEVLKEAEQLFGEPDTIHKAYCFGVLGLAHGTTKNNQLAIQYHEKALSLWRGFLGRDAVEAGNTFNNLGLLYTVEQPLQALIYFNRAKPIYEKQLGNDHKKTSLLLINMAFANLEQSEYDVALDLLNEVQASYERKYPGENANKAFVLSIMGRVFLEKNELDKALNYQYQALEMYISLLGEKHPDVANTYFLIGKIHQKNGDFELAVQFNQQSIYANFANQNFETLYDLPVLEDYFNADILLSSLSAKAKTLEALHYEKTLNTRDLVGAIDTYKLSDDLISIIRRQRLSEQDKLRLGEISKDVYENGIRLALILSRESFKKRDYMETAFEFCERSKSSVLLEAITETKAKKFSGIPEELLNLEDSLKDEISYIEQKLALPENAEDQTLKDLLFVYQKDYREFITKLENEYPEYYELKYSHSLATVQQVQDNLDGKSALLSYYIATNEIFIFIVTKKGIKAVTKTKSESFDKYSNSLRNAIKYNVTSAFISSAQGLYEQLIPTLPKNITELVILPDGVLGTIPFEALVNSKDENPDFKTASFLIRDYHVSYDYSATLFTQRETDDDDTDAKILLVAPVSFEENEVKMATLPGSEEEIMEIRYLFMGTSSAPTVKTKQNASENNLKLEDLDRYKYLHFATHGLVNESEPALSRIFLTPGGGEDGSLYAGEIYNLKINADLVTLSACETGLGKVTKGEGVVGLSRALQYAGAKNIIVSLWQVADASTSQMMIEFYKYNLNNDHHGYNTALRKAKLSLLNSEEYNRPYYWAPFILVGM